MIDGPCQTFVADCHVRAAADLISHTWDAVVLSALRPGPTRRTDLLARIGGISDKVLTQALRRLCTRGLVVKVTEHRRVSYGLSPLGETFAGGPLAHLAQWAADHQADL